MVAFLLSAVVASIFAPVSESNAQTVTVENRATGYFVSVTSPDMVELSVDATPTGSTVISDASTINVVTNAPGGYKLYLSAEDNELKATNSDGTTNSSITQTFKPVTSTSLTNNTWGYSLDSGSSKNWSPVPSVPLPEINGGNTTESYMETKGASLISESNISNYPNGTDIDIYYGINADTTMPSGTYTTIVTYTAFAEGIPAIYTMQGFTTQECANMATDTQTELLDTRNNRTYTIVKARDGNCWMAENLSIYNTILTSDDTNLEQGTTFTLPESSNWDTNDYTQPLLHVAENAGYEGEVYYNWCSAVALTGSDCATTAQQQYNICPKGWTLPVNGTAATDKSYIKLMNSYGITTGAGLLVQTSLGFSKYYGQWRYSESSEGLQGFYGDFWTSTANASDTAYNIGYNSSTFYPQSYNAKGFGFSVRCVYENRTMSDITYMQDMTTQICNNTAEGTKKTLLDRRGIGNAGGTTGGYGVLKAKDGNCWMTDNLNLYNKTIYASDSDLQTGSFTIPTTSSWVNTYVYPKTYTMAYSGSPQIYYNYPAAVALNNGSVTVDPHQSICPKNWMLPATGGSTINKTYSKLFNVYSITKGSELIANSSLNFERYGKVDDGTTLIGYWGMFWMSAPNNVSQARALFYYYYSGADGLISGSSENKNKGMNVRCVSR